MDSAEADTVDVWIVGFDVSLELATEGLAAVFGVDDALAAALVASVPRGVRRGLHAAEADETVAALASIGAQVEVLPAGRRPAIVESLRPAPPPRPRVTLKRAARAALLEDEPAYGVGSAAYVPFDAPAPARNADAASGEDLPTGADELEQGPEEVFFEDDLQLGSLIPAARADVEAVDLQLELARLPKVHVGAAEPRVVAGASGAASLGGSRPSKATPPAADRARAAASLPTPGATSGPASSVPRVILMALAAVGVLLGALLLRQVLRERPEEGTAAGQASPAADGPTDAQLLARSEGLVVLAARIWLSLDDANRFGAMDGPGSRAFLNRLATAGALNTMVALESDSAHEAKYLLLQHTPFHTDSLREAATAHTTEAVVPSECVLTSDRYILIDLSDCPRQ